MTEYQVHPVAALFPMLPADELKALAEDIRMRGQLHPVVLDKDNQVIDGRNRLAACELVSVEPTFTTYEGDDPAGYAFAVNVARRQMKKGQIAVVAARVRRLNGHTQTQAGVIFNISRQSIAHADTVIDHAPDLADLVLSGDMALNDAYDDALENKKDAEEKRANRIRLKKLAPDLATLVDEERLSLSDAINALEARERQASEEADRNRQAAERDEQERRLADKLRWNSTAEAILTLRNITSDSWMNGFDAREDLRSDPVFVRAWRTDELLRVRDRIDQLIEWSKNR
jgi:hypothetical protein